MFVILTGFVRSILFESQDKLREVTCGSGGTCACMLHVGLKPFLFITQNLTQTAVKIFTMSIAIALFLIVIMLVKDLLQAKLA